MSPLIVDIGLWYYCRCGDYGDGNGDKNFTADAVQDAIRLMVEAGLLTPRADRAEGETRYSGTAGLQLWVQTICHVPWPVQKWMMP